MKDEIQSLLHRREAPAGFTVAESDAADAIEVRYLDGPRPTASLSTGAALTICRDILEAEGYRVQLVEEPRRPALRVMPPS